MNNVLPLISLSFSFFCFFVHWEVIAFTLGAMFAAISGMYYPHYISYIDPTSSFTVDESIFILYIIIIGGMRNLWGSVIAAAFLVFLPEALRFVGMPLLPICDRLFTVEY